jgi:hypothetical protein
LVRRDVLQSSRDRTEHRPGGAVASTRTLDRGLVSLLLEETLSCRNADEREAADKSRHQYKIDVERVVE